MSRAHRHLGTPGAATPSLPTRRPAETSTAVVAALVGLAGKAWDLDGDTMAYLVVVLGALPGAVTALVEWRRRVGMVRR